MSTVKLAIPAETSTLLSRVAAFLEDKGIRSYLVGGFLRDVIAGRPAADIDIATDGDPLAFCEGLAASTGGKPVVLDEVNRVCRIVLPGLPELDFSALRGDIDTDLAERDFTIDAMAVELAVLARGGDVTLLDPFGGRDDLAAGMVRALSERVLIADPVRLLRAVRLAGELGFEIETETQSLVQRHHALLSGVAGERLREEFVRLLAVPRGEPFLLELDRLGLLAAIIPELEESRGVTQPKEHFWDVLNHALRTPAAADFLLRQGEWVVLRGHAREALAAVPWSDELEHYFGQEVSHGSARRTLLKLAALLHDIAKPRTRTVEANGRTRFFDHAPQGAEMAASALKRLRFSGREIKLVETMIRYHMRPTQLSQEGLPTRRAIYRFFRDAGDASVDTLFLSLADHLATRGPRLIMPQWREHARIVAHVLAEYFQPEGLAAAAPRLITGNDIMQEFGLSPGPLIGELLEAAREAQAAGEVATREDALEFVWKRLNRKQDTENV